VKEGRTLQDLAGELERQAKSKRDYVADTRALALRPDPATGAVVLEGVNGGMPLRPTAHEQLGKVLDIPKTYYDRLLADAPDLLAANVNHWLARQPAKKLIRTLDGGVRAILSDRYRLLDNLDLAEAVLPQLSRLEGEVLSGEVTERRFYLKAVTPKLQGEVKVGDVVQAGVFISNSEIGEGSLRVEELSYRLACLNGAIHAKTLRQTHAGRRASYDGADLLESACEYFRDETHRANDRAFFLQVRDVVAATLSPERFNARLESLRGSTDRRIEDDPVVVVEVTAQRFGLGEVERGGVLRHLVEGGDLSAWGLGNAITRTSQDVADYDRATDLEMFGGRVIELPSSEWQELAGGVSRPRRSRRLLVSA
jgi:hypothetical protein